MGEFPTGTVTFLFTDIEGSTRLWETQTGAMREAQARHDALLSVAIEEHGGHVFKTIGDAFCAAFASPGDAAQAAVQTQRALQREIPDVPVRMAVHTGEAEAREGDYFGLPLSHVDRLLDAGHGGQVLLSGATAEQLHGLLPEGTSLRPLGRHRLPDIEARDTIYQLQASDLPSDFPPLNTLTVAFRQGVVRAAAVAGMVIAVLAALALFSFRQWETARRHLYVTEMNAAYRVWEEGNMVRAAELLEKQRPRWWQQDLRGFEWRCLWRLCRTGELATLTGHTRGVSCLAFSRDGKFLATGGHDGTVKLWEGGGRAGTRCLATLRGQTARIRSLAFSPDSSALAIGRLRMLQWWPMPRSLATGTPAREARVLERGGERGVRSVAFSPDGRLLASGRDDGVVTLWDATTQRRRAELRGPGAWALAFSPDSRMLAAGGSGGILTLWDVTGRHPRETGRIGGYEEHIASVAFSPDGKRLAGALMDNTVRLWDLTSGAGVPREIEKLVGHNASITSVAFSPDGKLLVSGGADRTARLWAAGPPSGRWREMGMLRGHEQSISGVAFFADGKTLATCSEDQTVKFWSTAIQEEAMLDAHTGPMGATASAGAVSWKRGDGAGNRWKLVTSLAFSPDSRRLASGSTDTTIKLWNVADAARRSWPVQVLRGRISPGPQVMKLDDAVAGVAYSPDGRMLASTRRDGTVRLWNLATGRAATPMRHAGPVFPVAFSPDGRLLATATGEVLSLPERRFKGEVKLWDVVQPDAPRLLTTTAAHAGSVNGLAFSPDGRTLATGGADQTIRLWEIARTGGAKATLRTRATVSALASGGGTPTGLAFSPNGKFLASGTGAAAAVQVWGVSSPEKPVLLETLKGHSGFIPTVAFSPDGRTLASVGWDRKVKLWDVATWQELGTLSGHRARLWAVAFAPDGNTLASGAMDGTIRLWRAPTLTETNAPADKSPRTSRNGGRRSPLATARE